MKILNWLKRFLRGRYYTDIDFDNLESKNIVMKVEENGRVLLTHPEKVPKDWICPVCGAKWDENCDVGLHS